MDDQPQIWSSIRDLENRQRAAENDLNARLRAVEEKTAVLLSFFTQAQARGNYLPGWIIAIIGILVSAISVTASLWATGRTP